MKKTLTIILIIAILIAGVVFACIKINENQEKEFKSALKQLTSNPKSRKGKKR